MPILTTSQFPLFDKRKCYEWSETHLGNTLKNTCGFNCLGPLTDKPVPFIDG